MSDNLYNTLIERLRKMDPVPSSSERLTENIMAALDPEEKHQDNRLLLKANQKQWLLFSGFRIITTAAALFLLVFFVFEQRMINAKLNRLENQVAKTVPDATYSINTSYGVSHVMDLLQNSTVYSDSLEGESVRINRKSLEYLLERIRQLENENTGFRERLIQLHDESVTVQKPNS